MRKLQHANTSTAASVPKQGMSSKISKNNESSDESPKVYHAQNLPPSQQQIRSANKIAASAQYPYNKRNTEIPSMQSRLIYKPTHNAI